MLKTANRSKKTLCWVFKGRVTYMRLLKLFKPESWKSWKSIFFNSEDEKSRRSSSFVLDTLVITLQMHWNALKFDIWFE